MKEPAMDDDHSQHNETPIGQPRPAPFYKSMPTNAWVALGVVVAIVLFYLLTHHKTHVLDVLPYLLILAMIFMHVFMHGGHGGHGSSGGKRHE